MLNNTDGWLLVLPLFNLRNYCTDNDRLLLLDLLLVWDEIGCDFP